MATWNYKAGGAMVAEAPNTVYPTKTVSYNPGFTGGGGSASFDQSPSLTQRLGLTKTYANPSTSGIKAGISSIGNALNALLHPSTPQPLNVEAAKTTAASLAPAQATKTTYYSPNYTSKNDTTLANKTGSSTGSGSRSGASGSASASGTSGMSASDLYGQLMTSYLDQERAAAQAQYEAQRRAAQEAYDRGMGYLNDSYNNRQNSLRGNYNATLDALNSSYNNSSNKVNADANRSLQEAYINRMLSQRNLGQQLSAQGLNGGTSESMLASLYNNYGNARNGIENTRATNLADLENTFNQNKAGALQTLNNALANLESERAQFAMQLENALANNQIGASQNYASALSDVNGNYTNMLNAYLKNLQDYSYTPTEALNTVRAVAMTQANPENNTNYRNYLNLLGNLADNANASSTTDAVNTAANAALLQQLLGQL